MEFIRDNQLGIMLFMSGVAALLTLTILITNSLSLRRKNVLALMSFSAMLLLIFERFAYIYRGNPTELGYFMVRLSNGLGYFLLLFVLFLVTQYIKDLLKHEGRLPNAPFALKLCDLLFALGTILLVISQFTDLYYSFDSQNVYHRSEWMFISYFPPMLMVLLQELSVIRSRKRLTRWIFWSLAVSIALPSVAAIFQLLFYGVSLTCMSLVFVVIVYYVFVLNDMNKTEEKARKREIEFYKEAQTFEAALFEQTAEALVNAIDAKDDYTRGHSARVAALSRRIAELAEFSQEESEEVFFAALLHDVGKIGVPDGIIRKVGRLTEAEFEQIKQHTVIGDQILSSIRQSPTLRLGALCHHERYDGMGYPEGLAGEEIPRIARVIAVADAYDAMTSTRSYRGSLPTEQVKEELAEGEGKQFDPRFAEIMLSIIENETAEE